MKKSIKLVLISVTTFFIILFVWDGFIRDKTPQLFPINLAEGQYTIRKNSSGILEVEYSGPETFNNQNIISVLVGKTSHNLNNYIGKKVRITKGKFVSGYTKQCIDDACVDIGGPYSVINVEELIEL